MSILLLFLLGLFVGSFLNVVADRFARNESIGFWTSQNDRKRSYCESCKHSLAWFDLIPLFSFLLIGGKCRYCKIKLSWYYPITELTTGILFAFTYWYINFQFPFFISHFSSPISYLSSLIFHLLIVSCLIVIFFADLKYYIIPDKILFPAVILSFLSLFIIHNSLFMIHLLSALGACLFFLLLFLGTRGRGMGFGDVKYAFFMGLLLGFPKIIVGLYVAFLTGAFIALILILWGKKKLKGSTIPFGPFLVIGTMVGIFWGDFILKYVFSTLLR